VREEVVLGPAAGAAYDGQGRPGRAALGFAAKQGVPVEDLFLTETEKGVYAAVRRRTGGLPAAAVLAGLLPGVIASLPFPRRMRWGKGSFAFARPLRWLLALLDGDEVSFRVGDVEAGRRTWGHRAHGPGPFSVSHASALEQVLTQKGRVMPSAGGRRDVITAGGDALARAAGGRVLWKDGLLDEVQGLVEWPVPMIGGFDPSFLELPREVLLTSMETHQKSFGLENAEGVLLPHFLTVLNLEPDDISVVRRGWERVLRARLEDARFYWRADLGDGFPVWLEKLEQVVFLGPLGSMADKCRRLEELCAWLAGQSGIRERIGVDGRTAAAAGRLSKADLVSRMVGEFDTLQGVMGGIYAGRMGMDPLVAAALAEQYLPAGPDTPVPATDAGALLSLADKADTLAGCFGLGNIPTGAADPYALRRAALGIARIFLEKGWRLPVAEIFRQAFALYRENPAWKLPVEEALGKLNAFFEGRLKNLLLARYEDTLLVEAVTGAGCGDVWATGRRMAALREESRKPGWQDNVRTFKRVSNILRKQDEAPDGQWRPSLLAEEPEKKLAAVLDNMAERFDALWAADRFGDLLSLMDEVRPTVDAFFDGVMVMAEDREIRLNRLNLLRSLMSRMDRLADFSALQM
jgi:glycyl-tRNA synthetase beta chain